MRKTRLPTYALAVSLLLIMLSSSAWAATPNPEAEAKTPIKHLLVLMQENHSFDNYFGTYPGANGIPADVCMPVDPFKKDSTECVRPFHIGDNEVELADPDHSDATHKIQFNDGRMDGFIYALNRRNQDGRLAMGYYDDRDLPYYWNLADEYVLFDQFFSSAAGGSFVNHLFWVAADADENADRLNGKSIDQFTTIFDRLEERGISWKFYVQNYEPRLTYRTLQEFPGNRAAQVIWCPLLNFDRFIDDPKLSSHIVNIDQYFEDLQKGTLPAVAYIVPSGPSEHPPSSIQAGQKFVRSLIQALMQREAWYSSAFMVVYDDWGGWYDHVPPPQVDEFGYGFRVPGFLVSPYAKRGHIDHTALDYTSIIKFISDNYDLEPLAERDAKANSFVSAFDFNQAPREPRFIPFDRATEEKRPEPRRSVIFIAYGLALLVTMLLIAFAVWRTRRSSKQARPDLPQDEESPS
jgi:phospholipase C